MTTTIEAPATRAADESEATRAHRALFSDPDAVKATAVRDLEALPAAAQAPVFSSPY